MIGAQAPPALPIDATSLGQLDALALALPDHGTLELGEGAHHRQHRLRDRAVVAGEGELFRDEVDSDALGRVDVTLGWGRGRGRWRDWVVAAGKVIGGTADCAARLTNVA